MEPESGFSNPAGSEQDLFKPLEQASDGRRAGRVLYSMRTCGEPRTGGRDLWKLRTEIP
jgi:hypothetical protein